MTTNIINGQADQSQINDLNRMRIQIEQSTSTPTFNTSNNSKTYFVAFDGTWNDRDNTKFGIETNVSLLDKQAFTQGIAGKYYPGVGTTGFAPLSWIDSGTGLSIHSTARTATTDFQTWAREQFEANPNVKIDLAGVSFSRGGITHTAFLNNVYNEGVGKKSSEIYNTNDNGDRVVTGYNEHWIKPKSDDLGRHLMMDRVAGPINLMGKDGTVLPPAANLQVTNIRAQDEHRREFASESLRNPDGAIDKRFREIDVAGAHSNIGGGYINNGIADHVLDGGLKYFKAGGLDLGQAPQGHRIGDQPLNINNSYADWTNGAYGLGGPDAPNWKERKDNTNTYVQPAPASPSPALPITPTSPAIQNAPTLDSTSSAAIQKTANLLENSNSAAAKPVHVRPEGGYVDTVTVGANGLTYCRDFNQETGASMVSTFNSDGMCINQKHLDANGVDVTPKLAQNSPQLNQSQDQQPSGPKLELSFG